ncbi:hypothetical protein [Nocardia terpenica]|uniref:Uncharacterized protein n=1 Tax=Nocardia terpenica TaxID=455432 RepID=A0A164LCL0_9NOCA|nr:hypothetical protein [Nocardia terpenica]KZM72260.1 hypothetical protein AWN90_36915 [Nocardia terpenica]NQE86593.1 hypothetical protein [Nocardia terpenica]
MGAGIRAAISRRQQREIDLIHEAGRKHARKELDERIDEAVKKARKAISRGDHRAAQRYADQANADIFVRDMEGAGDVDLLGRP